MKKRKEQKEFRRQEIIYAALELFVSKGYAATKVTDIAKKVNMSTGLMFHYFESKEKLYEELIRMGLEGTTYSGNSYESKCDRTVCAHYCVGTARRNHERRRPFDNL